MVQSKLARARAGRGSMLGPTPAAKKLAKPVPFGGVQTNLATPFARCIVVVDSS